MLSINIEYELFPFSRRAHQMLQQQQQRPSTRTAKQNAFVATKLGWPPYFKFGNFFFRKKNCF
jgi:hypothetical protein